MGPRRARGPASVGHHGAGGRLIECGSGGWGGGGRSCILRPRGRRKERTLGLPSRRVISPNDVPRSPTGSQHTALLPSGDKEDVLAPKVGSCLRKVTS